MLRCGHVSTELLGPSGTPPLTSLITGCSMVAIAMEYYPNGSLYDYIIQHQPPFSTILNILCDVVFTSAIWHTVLIDFATVIFLQRTFY